MEMQDIARKSLVVAVWDQDSTSRDDYMAGVCGTFCQVEFLEYIFICLDKNWSERHKILWEERNQCEFALSRW